MFRTSVRTPNKAFQATLDSAPERDRSHKGEMKAYLGFIPLAVVAVPFLAAAIRQALFYKGCMDGLGYILIAMGAFMVGGVLNVAYLLFVTVTHRTHFTFESRRQRVAAKAGFIGALFLLVIQAMVVASIAWKKLIMD